MISIKSIVDRWQGQGLVIRYTRLRFLATKSNANDTKAAFINTLTHIFFDYSSLGNCMAKVKAEGYICDGPMSGLSITPDRKISARFTMVTDDGDYYDCLWNGRLAYVSYPYLIRGQQVSIKGKVQEKVWVGESGNEYLTTELVVRKAKFGIEGPGDDPLDQTTVTFSIRDAKL